MSENMPLDRALIAKLMTETGTPGVCVGIWHRGETLLAGLGVTNVDHPLPVTTETLFQIGSITKTFTATALLRLMERGLVELDAPVRRYLPEFALTDERATAGATIWHLLTHTGGWVGDYFEDTGPGDDALSRFLESMQALEQLAPLGLHWSYNNSGFVVAGRIIEVVTGTSFQQALKELVIGPLGLERTFFDPGDVMTHRFAAGHIVNKEGSQVAKPWPIPRSSYPAGGITCSLEDLLSYAQFHLNGGVATDGTQLLQNATMNRMHTPQAKVWGDESWGLGWCIDELDGTRLLEHGGGTNGQISLLLLAPEQRFALAIFTNGSRGGRITQQVGDWALQTYLGIERPVPSPILSPATELAECAGHYHGAFDDVDLSLQDGALVMQISYKMGFPDKDCPPPPSPPPMHCLLCDPDRLLVIDGPLSNATLELVRKTDGTIGWLRSSKRLHVRR